MTKAYRGYLIHTHPFNGEVWITKGGAHICYAPSEAQARAEIDALLMEGRG